jgi:hypothetical protein
MMDKNSAEDFSHEGSLEIEDFRQTDPRLALLKAKAKLKQKDQT